MANDIIQAEYDTLEDVAGLFLQQSDEIATMHKHLAGLVQNLNSGGWEGRGSDAFFAEMQDEIFPAVQRLVEALDEGGTTTRQIAELLQSAEEDAANQFQIDHQSGAQPGGGAPGGTPGGGPISVPGLPFPVTPGGPGSSTGGGSGAPFDIPAPLRGLWDAINGGIGISEFFSDFEGPIPPRLGVVFDTVLGTLGNPDGDWLKSFGSSAITALGTYAATTLSSGPAAPAVALALAVDAATQGVSDLGNYADDFLAEWIARDPAELSRLNAVSDRFHATIDRLGLGNTIEPLGDIVYELTVGPGWDAARDLWNDPSWSNFGRYVGATASPILFADHGEILSDAYDVGHSLVDRAIAQVELPFRAGEYVWEFTPPFVEATMPIIQSGADFGASVVTSTIDFGGDLVSGGVDLIDDAAGVIGDILPW